jgi:hypothetical protein
MYANNFGDTDMNEHPMHDDVGGTSMNEPSEHDNAGEVS